MSLVKALKYHLIKKIRKLLEPGSRGLASA